MRKRGRAGTTSDVSWRTSDVSWSWWPVGLCAALGVALGLGVRAFDRVSVTGPSMRPTLEPGDRLLVLRWGRRWRLRNGDLVTVLDPRPHETDHVLVKRVVDRRGDRLTVLGDNRPFSTDSRDFGLVSIDSIRGRVLYRYAPSVRSGVIRRGRWSPRTPVPSGVGEW